jgi:hypothetical protein
MPRSGARALGIKRRGSCRVPYPPLGESSRLPELVSLGGAAQEASGLQIQRRRPRVPVEAQAPDPRHLRASRESTCVRAVPRRLRPGRASSSESGSTTWRCATESCASTPPTAPSCRTTSARLAGCSSTSGQRPRAERPGAQGAGGGPRGGPHPRRSPGLASRSRPSAGLRGLDRRQRRQPPLRRWSPRRRLFLSRKERRGAPRGRALPPGPTAAA